MVWVPSGWQWVPFFLVLVLAYEVVRSTIVGIIKARYERKVQDFLRTQNIPEDPFRHTHRVVVKERVLADPGLHQAIVDRGKKENKPFHAIEAQVREWLDEIVPQFSILAYYEIGYRIARLIAYSVYNVHLDHDSLEAARAKIPEDAAVVYVSNHRSNADFVVTGFMLSKSVQVSYAVGEWARVWPLEKLFRSFGSYFVRRGEKDPLYHRTLEAYLQLITKEGVTQAMFPEGGLTRDGKLRPPKLGLLDYMARCKLDGDFQRPLVFVPVGINFDHVIEDENMLREHRGIFRHKKPWWWKLGRSIVVFPRWIAVSTINGVRFFTRRLKKHGMVGIHFGEPIVFDDWMKQHKPRLDEPDRKQRLDQIEPFGELLMDRIAHVIPATPVTFVCAAMQAIGEERMKTGVDRGSMVLAMRQVHDELSKQGAPLALTGPYENPTGRFRRQAARDISQYIDDAELLADTLRLAVDVMKKRHILYVQGGVYRTQRWDLVTYYANSLCRDVQLDVTA